MNMKLSAVFAGVATALPATGAMAATGLLQTAATGGLSAIFGGAVGLAAGLWVGYKLVKNDPGGDGSANVGLVLGSGAACCVIGATLGLGAGIALA